MKKIIYLVPVLLLTAFIFGSSFKPIHKKTAKTTSSPKACTNVVPANVHAVVSGSTVTVTWNAQSGSVYFTVGGYYSSGGQIPYSCPATSGYTFPRNGGGTLRVTSWCGTSCATGTNGLVSGPVTF